MIRISQLKLKTDHTEADLKEKIRKTLHLKEDALLSYRIQKRSIDARKKPELSYVYTVDAEVRQEKQIQKLMKNPNISIAKAAAYTVPVRGTMPLSNRPVIVGSGPAGLFCAYLLADLGYCPILVERGAPVEERTVDVKQFWETGILNPESNVQFGEGGAGTFSDGKLNTLVKDSGGRNHYVLRLLHAYGAPEEVLYDSKPHIGTDILTEVVKNIRNAILEKGGEVRFYTQITDIICKDRKLHALVFQNHKTGECGQIKTGTAVLALGHSARDTFETLCRRQIPMEAKSFAVGVRVEHPQSLIDHSQYGRERGPLPAAAYKLAATLDNQRGVYTFCMCPGGYVVNASSEENCLAVNGMSYHSRAGEHANSAVIVTVGPKDFRSAHPLAGVAFQRELERKAYEAGSGNIPVQRFEDFRKHRPSSETGKWKPQMKGSYVPGDVRSVFPEELSASLEQGILEFGQKIKGYDSPDALLSAVESRTSSPVRILRDEGLESDVKGIYPCGEGAGYAGGITSAAMDGLKVAEAIVRKYRPFDNPCD